MTTTPEGQDWTMLEDGYPESEVVVAVKLRDGRETTAVWDRLDRCWYHGAVGVDVVAWRKRDRQKAVPHSAATPAPGLRPSAPPEGQHDLAYTINDAMTVHRWFIQRNMTAPAALEAQACARRVLNDLRDLAEAGVVNVPHSAATPAPGLRPSAPPEGQEDRVFLAVEKLLRDHGMPLNEYGAGRLAETIAAAMAVPRPTPERKSRDG